MADYARLIDRTMLQTPVHRYVHPDTSRQVTLIGTVHVGEAGYYEKLRGLIEPLEADGAVVHCEGGSAVALRTADPTGLTPDETRLFSALRRLKNMESAAVAALGWTGQVQGLGYPQRWQIVDMPFIEILRAVGPEEFWRQARQMVRPLVVYKDPARALAWFRAGAVIGLRAAARGNRIPGARGDEVIVDQRNQVALSGVDGTDRDTVLLWGAAHLPGLDTGLWQRGYTRVDTEWYDVMRLPPAGALLWYAIRSKRRARQEANAAPTPPTGSYRAVGTPRQPTGSRPS